MSVCSPLRSCTIGCVMWFELLTLWLKSSGLPVNNVNPPVWLYRTWGCLFEFLRSLLKDRMLLIRKNENHQMIFSREVTFHTSVYFEWCYLRFWAAVNETFNVIRVFGALK